MRSKRSYLGVTIVMAVMLSTMAARADTLYSTLGPSGEFDASNGYFVDGSNFFNQVMASPFTVSSTATLTNAMLGLNNFSGGNNPVNLFVESDAGGMPGAILGALTQVGTIPPFNTQSLTTFTSTGLALTAGTVYWLVAQETDPGTEQAWDYAFNDATNTIAFNQLGSTTGPWTTFSGTDVAFQINGAPIPEPATFALLGTGLLVGVAGAVRRRLKF